MSSLKDVSKLAGVSPSTVSRVITGTIRVDEDTKKRVLEAIDELKYKPNLIARGLRNRSGRLIGLMVPEIMHETFAAFISHVEEACVRRGFTMILGNTREDPATEDRVLSNFVGMNVDGIIISRVSDKSAVMSALESSGIAVVGIDRALDDELTDHVLVDNRLAGEIAAKYFWSMGHRKLVCISGPESISLSRERLEGFKTFFAERDIGINHVAGDDFEFEAGLKCIRRILEQGIEFTGIWAENDLMAIGAMRELKRLGMKIPEDISIIGMDDIKTTQMVLPALTTVRQPYSEICDLAVDLLLQRIENPEAEPRRVILAPELVIRDSVLAVDRVR
ncbi:MAG: LacI family DNA-binding transcriptional regulator [Rectinemataceae bacterium]